MKILLWAAAASALALTSACATGEVVGYTKHGKPVVCDDVTGGCYVRHGHRYTAYSEPWTPPAGYEDRDWEVGATLPDIYWGAEIDWRTHNLTDPGHGKHWVRVGNSAVLIDGKGRVVDKIKGFYR